MSYLVIGLIIAVLAGAVVVPFTVGFIRGPAAGQSQQAAGAGFAQVLSPLSRIATLYGRFPVLYVIIEVGWIVAHKSNDNGVVCGNTPYTTSGAGGSGTAAVRGASLQSNGTVQVCTAHPTPYEWFLYALIRLPNLILWGAVLVLLWQLIRRAAHGGPFTRQSAACMYLLGLVILAGTAIAAAISALGADLLERLLLTQPGYLGAGIAIDALIRAPLEALVPWPALIGAALISFARITLLGVALDEEVRATV